MCAFSFWQAGCSIEETERRAITVPQLKGVRTHIERRCESEGWVNSLDQAKLMPKTVNLYVANDHVIMPATSVRKCAYVELVAAGAQSPKWFCSHWWGEPVFDFVACVETHAMDHGYDDATAYWVCAVPRCRGSNAPVSHARPPH